MALEVWVWSKGKLGSVEGAVVIDVVRSQPNFLLLFASQTTYAGQDVKDALFADFFAKVLSLR